MQWQLISLGSMTRGVTWQVLYGIVAKPLCLPFLILVRPKVKLLAKTNLQPKLGNIRRPTYNNFAWIILAELVFCYSRARSKTEWIRSEWTQNHQGRRFGEDRDEISFGISVFRSKQGREAVREYGVGANVVLVKCKALQ